MTKHKNKTLKNNNEKNKLVRFVFGHKLIISLSVILLLALLIFPYNKYKDWDNAQQIKGIARDFPALVVDIEQATGLDLEIKKDCSVTQEKYSDGVKTCEVSVASLGSEEEIEKAFEIMQESKVFKKAKEYDNREGHEYKYRNMTSCQFRETERIYSTCIIAVREANEGLATEVFSNIQQ